mmetsp:Transcript_23070/g.80422  ORF Transcript_23070/g.80422 Transcript_23070/m.80422 type:complete len:220 (-) Transcript_23070:530-1189(-)
MPCSSAAATTSASATLPPGCTTKLTPTRLAASIESRKGKKASDASATPDMPPRNSAFSSACSRSGSASISSMNAAHSASLKPPSMKPTRALTLSGLRTPRRNGNARTFGCCRSRHVAALRAASLTQSTRLCCPAPTPSTCPLAANATELLCAYLMATDASSRSCAAAAGSAVRAVVTCVGETSSSVSARSLRRCAKCMPNTSRYSTGGGTNAASASSTM